MVILFLIIVAIANVTYFSLNYVFLLRGFYLKFVLNDGKILFFRLSWSNLTRSIMLNVF